MKKEDVIKILNENTKWVGDYDTQTIGSCRFEEIAERIVKLCNIQNVVCSALSDEVATKMLAHCPYEKSGWCTTELGCRSKLENCDAKGNGCELAL